MLSGTCCPGFLTSAVKETYEKTHRASLISVAALARCPQLTKIVHFDALNRPFMPIIGAVLHLRKCPWQWLLLGPMLVKQLGLQTHIEVRFWCTWRERITTAGLRA